MSDFDGHYRVFISKVQSLVTKMTDMNCELVFVLDSFPQAKKDIYPEYKDGRKKFDFDPKKGLLSALSQIIEFKIAKVKGYEADDVMASIVAQNPDRNSIVVTSDKDLWVLLKHPNCNVYDLSRNEYVTHEDYVNKFRLSDYKHLTLYKTLWGDNSDNIPNAMPALQKSMIPIISETDGTLADFMSKFEANRSKLSKAVIAKYDANQDQLIDNYTLVSLNSNLEVTLHPYVRGLEYHI